MGNSVLTFEELTTLFCQIEAVLNSRLISVMSADPSEVEPLTPAHHPIGHGLDLLPSILLDQGYNVDECSPQNRWYYIQNILLHFWNRWTNERVTTFLERSKWRQETSNLRVGDSVFITDDNSTPLQWVIGRIHYVYSGPDSAVRVVKVNTSTGKYHRLHKLKKLPIDT